MPRPSSSHQVFGPMGTVGEEVMREARGGWEGKGGRGEGRVREGEMYIRLIEHNHLCTNLR